MTRLGYDNYYAQGGDWGSAVTTAMGTQNKGRCKSIHVNMPIARVPRKRHWKTPRRQTSELWLEQKNSRTGAPVIPNSKALALKP